MQPADRYRAYEEAKEAKISKACSCFKVVKNVKIKDVQPLMGQSMIGKHHLSYDISIDFREYLL